MGHYDTMQVCLKGHKITAYYDTQPNGRQKHCDICGKRTIIVCESCGAKIRGKYHVDGAISFDESKSTMNCHDCGRAYPWKGRFGFNIWRKTAIPRWLKSTSGWIAKNIVLAIVVGVLILVISAVILFKMGIKV